MDPLDELSNLSFTEHAPEQSVSNNDKQADASEYYDLVRNYVNRPAFQALEDDQSRATALSYFRDSYMDRRAANPRDTEAISGLTKTYFDYSKSQRLFPTQEDTQSLGLGPVNFNDYSKDQALAKIGEYRTQINDKITGFDPVKQEDYKFYYDSWLDEEERKVRGRETGRLADLHYRTIQGFGSRLLTSVGQSELSDELSNRFLTENPAYDDSFWSDLATGGGDMVFTMGATLGVAAATGGNLYAVAATGLYINGVGKYEQAYKQAMEQTGNPFQAHDAGVGALPGAVVETLGEYLIAGRITKAVPNQFKLDFIKAGTAAERRAIVTQHLKDASFMRNMGREFLTQGAQESVSESAGSAISGLGASYMSGLDMTQTPQETAREGAAAFVLGGGMGGASGFGDAARATDYTRSRLQEIEAALKSGDDVALRQAVYAKPPTLPTETTDSTEADTPTKDLVNEEVVPRFNITPELTRIRDGLGNILQARLPRDEGPSAESDETTDALGDDLSDVLPQRKAFFGAMDQLGLPAEQVERTKALIDGAAMNMAARGIDPNFIYSNIKLQTAPSATPRMSSKEWKTLSYQFDRYRELSQGITHPGQLTDIRNEVFGYEEFIRPVGWFEQLEKRFEAEANARNLKGLRSYVGGKAQLNNVQVNQLQKANEMRAQGIDDETVRLVTGWFPGEFDGKPRMEISDHAATIKNVPAVGQQTTLGEVLDHPELFALYPALQNVVVKNNSQQDYSFLANDNLSNSEIQIDFGAASRNPAGDDTLGILMHEVAHAVQNIEGFDVGANEESAVVQLEAQRRATLTPAEQEELTQLTQANKEFLTNSVDNVLTWGDDQKKELKRALNATNKTPQQQRLIHRANLETNWRGINDGNFPESDRLLDLQYRSKPRPYEVYWRVSGEMEARDVQNRVTMTPEERAATPPMTSPGVGNIDRSEVFRRGGFATLPQKQSMQLQEESELEEILASTPATDLPANSRDLFEPGLIKPTRYLSRETIVDMPIDMFLDLAYPLDVEGRAFSNVSKNIEALQEIIQGGHKFTELPFLMVQDFEDSETSKVTGHEGRHRAMALKALGYTTMPVVFNSKHIRWSEQTDPSKFDYREQWPTRLTSEDGSLEVDYPVGRDGSFNQILSQQATQKPTRKTVAEANADYLTALNNDDMEGQFKAIDSIARAEADEAYFALIDDPSGNEKELRKILDDLGKKFNFSKNAYHASPNVGFTEFKLGSPRSHEWSVSTGNAVHLSSNIDPAYKGSKGEARRFYIPSNLITIKREGGEVLLKTPHGSDIPTEGMFTDDLISGIERISDEAKEFAQKRGYAGFQYYWNSSVGTEYAILDPNKIKSYDLITYDESGNIIPPSERFNDQSPSILYQGQQDNVKGLIQFPGSDLFTTIEEFQENLQAIITITEDGGDITALHHELMHFYNRSGILIELLTPEQYAAFEKAAGVKNHKWTRGNYELVARTYEAWLRNPKLPFESRINVPDVLHKAFEAISSAFRSIYKSLKGSPLPSKEVGGRTLPNIHPDMRVAFESLYSQPNIGLAPPAAQTAQAPPQSPQVNPRLASNPSQVSPPPADTQLTDSQPTTTEEVAEPTTYELDERDQLNIKLLAKVRTKGSSLEATLVKLFKDINKLRTGLVDNVQQSGMYYALMDNYIRARVLLNDQLDDDFGNAQEMLANPKSMEGLPNELKDPLAPAYAGQLAEQLRKIKEDAEQRWVDNYREKNEQWLEDAPEGMSRLEMVQYVNDQRRKKESTDPTTQRISINDNVALLRANLRHRLDNAGQLDDLLAELGVEDNVNEQLTKDYIEFLLAADVESPEMSDFDALDLQINLDSIVNNGVLVGLKDNFAKHKAKALMGTMSPKPIYRDAYSKWGLVGLLTKFTGSGEAAAKVLTRLGLTSANLERLAGSSEARDSIMNLLAEYQYKVGQMQLRVNAWTKHLEDTKAKWWPKLTVTQEDMHRAGMASKIMQAPRGAEQDVKDEFVRENYRQLLKGINQIISWGGQRAVNGQAQLKLLNEVMGTLDPETMTQAEFLQQLSTNLPAEHGFIMDSVEWIEDNIKQGAAFVSEGLFGVEFNEFELYLPTRQVPIDESRYENSIEIDQSAMLNNMGDQNISSLNPVTVDRADALKSRSGYVKEGFAFATNLESTLDTSVKAVLNDMYLGFERQVLNLMLHPNSSLRAEMDALLGNAGRTAHLAQVIKDMVSTDLNEHPYINGVELLANRLRRNIGPASLSSLHQPISQSLSQWTAHLARRPQTLKDYADAFKLLALVDRDSPLYQSWLMMKEAHLSTRALPQDPLFVRGKNYQTNPLDELGNTLLEKMGLEGKKVKQLSNWFKVADEKFKQNVLLAPLRFGDLISADTIFAAELINRAKQEQKTNELNKLNLANITPESVHQAIVMMDESINASRNSRRGYLSAHPNAVMSLLTVFSGHRLSMATNAGLKFRNMVELGTKGDWTDPMFADSARFLASTVAQSIVFTVAKAAVGAVLIRGIYQAMTPEEDDRRYHLYGDLEKQEVEAIRKITDDTINRSFSADSLWKATLRDASGSLFWGLSFFGLDNYWFARLDDSVKPVWNKSKEEAVKELKAQLNSKWDELTPEQRQDLSNQIKVVENSKYVPFSYKDFSETELGGAYGLAMEPAVQLGQNAVKLVAEGDTPDMADWLLVGKLLGYSQPEIAKYLKLRQKHLERVEEMRSKQVDTEEQVNFGF